MDYDRQKFVDAVEQFGEVFFVLDSGEEYIVHGKEGYEFINNDGTIRVEGMRDGEWIVGIFNLDAIEHHYTHKEV